MIELVNRFYPRKLKENYEQLLMYCNFKMNVNKFILIIFIVDFIVAFLLTLFLQIFTDFSFILLYIIIFILFQAAVYAWLVLTADARAKFVEELLPDVLQLMSSNLRAGLTIDKALLLSARPEFGRFRQEINTVGKELATGKELHVALMGLAKRIKSDKVKKTMQIIVSAMASGGQLADLLEQTANNLRQQRMIEQRIRASVLVYVIFIFSAISFGAPMLFGLSSFLVEVITNIFSNIQLPPAGTMATMPLTFTKVSISPRFVTIYAITSLVLTSVMGSLILGLIAKGKEKEGLKFLPILVIMTISLFFIVRFFIRTLLGGLFDF